MITWHLGFLSQPCADHLGVFGIVIDQEPAVTLRPLRDHLQRAHGQGARLFRLRARTIRPAGQIGQVLDERLLCFARIQIGG